MRVFLARIQSRLASEDIRPNELVKKFLELNRLDAKKTLNTKFEGVKCPGCGVNKNSLKIHAWWLDFKSVMLWKKTQGSDTFMPMEF
mgnify:CR=1 FL=1